MEVDYNNWLPLALANRGPQLSYLFFADDIILTAKVIPTTCQWILHTLAQFTKLSRQIINCDKSQIVFSQNCTTPTRTFVPQFFHINEEKSFGKYLGFPIFIKQPTKRDYQFLIDNFKTKLAGWKINFYLKQEGLP